MLREYTIEVTDFKSEAGAFTGHKAYGKVRLIGIDPGEAELVAYNPVEETLVWKCKGHSYWNGIGQPQRYAPTTLVFAALSESLVEGKRLRARVLIEYTPGKGKG